MEITTVVVAILSVIGQVILLLLQRKQAKAQAKKVDNEASGILVDKALNINKQEMENMRLLLDVIKKEYQEALVCIDKQEIENENLKLEVTSLEKKFKRACELLLAHGIDAKLCD